MLLRLRLGVGANSSVSATTEMLCGYFERLLEEPDFFQRIHREMRHDDYSAVYQSMRRYYRQHQLDQLASALGADPDERCMFEVNFFVYGTSNAIAAWAASGMKQRPRVLAESIVGCVPPHLANVYDELM